jgi:hypothetical protein
MALDGNSRICLYAFKECKNAMTSFSTTIICDIAALSLGVLLAVFATRVPKRGWVGLVLLVSSALAWSLIDSGDSSQPSRLPMLLIFLIPLALDGQHQIVCLHWQRLWARSWFLVFCCSWLLALFMRPWLCSTLSDKGVPRFRVFSH